jgi:hypothetical protein
MSASRYFATKKRHQMELAILWKNVLQLSPKSTCKKHPFKYFRNRAFTTVATFAYLT